MPDNQPVRMPQTAQRIQPSPRRQSSAADPCAMVLFGGTGDLTKRLLMPALYNLSRTKLLPEKFALIGVDLAKGTAESWRDHLYDRLKSFVGNSAARHESSTPIDALPGGNHFLKVCADKTNEVITVKYTDTTGKEPSLKDTAPCCKAAVTVH